MTSKEFEVELKKIDERLTVIENPNRPGLSNIMYDGHDVCPIPTDNIKDEDDPRYYYVFPNGYSAPHNSIRSATEKVHGLIEKLKDKNNHDAFYGVGDYA